MHTPNEKIKNAFNYLLVNFTKNLNFIKKQLLDLLPSQLHNQICDASFSGRSWSFNFLQFLFNFLEWFSIVYQPENLHLLRQNRDKVLAFLDGMDVPYLKPSAGFFVLANFSKFMLEQTVEEENRLCKKFIQNKVLLMPGEIIK